MGIADEVRASFGEDFFDRKSDRTPGHHWAELCVCGHLDRYHSPSTGGAYRLPPPDTKVVGGEDVTVTKAFHGCVGALKPRGFEEVTATADRTARTKVEQINPTCPCEEFRGVVTVDRPNRYFNQRMPTDRTDPARHPFMLGIRAFMTHLSRRKQAMADPGWHDKELSRRFIWMDGARVCSMAKCTETEDVWPIFTDTDATGDRSELRCPAHR